MFLTGKRSKWIYVKFRIVIALAPKLQSQLDDFLSLVEWHMLSCPDVHFRSKVKDVSLKIRIESVCVCMCIMHVCVHVRMYACVNVYVCIRVVVGYSPL